MSDISKVLDDILYEDKGYTTTHERRLSKEEKTARMFIEGCTEHQLAIIEKMVNARKEKIQHEKVEEKQREADMRQINKPRRDDDFLDGPTNDQDWWDNL